MRALSLSAVMVACLLAGCIATPPMPNTGIVPIGKDTYMSSKFGGTEWSGSVVKAELYKDAGEFCAKKGLQVVPLDSTSKDASAYQYASAEIQFRCG